MARELPYTYAMLQETLRLCLSVPKDVKVAVADDVLPDGTAVAAGSVVAYLPHAMGRYEANWEAAETYDPGRFMDGKKHSPFRFIAFNAGPRTCLGQNMALLEASLVLPLVYRRYRVEVVAGQTVTYANSLTLPMLEGIRAALVPRA